VLGQVQDGAALGLLNGAQDEDDGVIDGEDVLVA